VQQTIYLARRNPKPSDNTDYFEIISWSEPKSVFDDAAPAKCKLVAYDQVPTYEL
jgi:branched-chain amino acid transport system substrate-binding protein